MDLRSELDFSNAIHKANFKSAHCFTSKRLFLSHTQGKRQRGYNSIHAGLLPLAYHSLLTRNGNGCLQEVYKAWVSFVYSFNIIIFSNGIGSPPVQVLDQRKPSKPGPYIGKINGLDLFRYSSREESLNKSEPLIAAFNGPDFDSSREEFLSKSKPLIAALNGPYFNCFLRLWTGEDPLPFRIGPISKFDIRTYPIFYRQSVSPHTRHNHTQFT